MDLFISRTDARWWLAVSTITHTTLLVGLRAPTNDRAWSQYNARYQPLIVSVARRLGLSDQDAQDAAQETLFAFADSYRKGKYDRDKGRLRHWLLAIATRKIRDFQRRQHRLRMVDAPNKTMLMDGLADQDAVGQVWEAEWRRTLMQECVNEACRNLEAKTTAAFELFVLQEWPADRVAAHLGISSNAVFKAKRRVLSRMREVYTYLEANW